MTRLEAILSALHWQGGTIHQVAEATGCKADELLYTESERGWHCTAYHVGNINGSNHAMHGTHRFLDPATGKAFAHAAGRLQYWLGVADGYREARKEAA